MNPTLYFDDPDEGLSHDTSHPRFVELATDGFYYDVCDDFSPFGSDDGADTLYALEDWYRTPDKNHEAAIDFLKSMLAGWDYGVPADILRADAAARTAWLKASEMNEIFLVSECRARVAMAFGQLKITGKVDADILDEAIAAIECQLWLNECGRPARFYTHPDKQRMLQAQASLKQRLLQMQALLQSL